MAERQPCPHHDSGFLENFILSDSRRIAFTVKANDFVLELIAEEFFHSHFDEFRAGAAQLHDAVLTARAIVVDAPPRPAVMAMKTVCFLVIDKGKLTALTARDVAAGVAADTGRETQTVNEDKHVTLGIPNCFFDLVGHQSEAPELALGAHVNHSYVIPAQAGIDLVFVRRCFN